MSPSIESALAVAAAQGAVEQTKDNSGNSDRNALSQQALRVVDGKRRALEYSVRLQGQGTKADELADCVAMLRDGVALTGFCRMQEASLGGQHA